MKINGEVHTFGGLSITKAKFRNEVPGLQSDTELSVVLRLKNLSFSPLRHLKTCPLDNSDILKLVCGINKRIENLPRIAAFFWRGYYKLERCKWD